MAAMELAELAGLADVAEVAAGEQRVYEAEVHKDNVYALACLYKVAAWGYVLLQVSIIC